MKSSAHIQNDPDPALNNRSRAALGRRDILRIGLVSGLATLMACTPYRAIMKDYPTEFKMNKGLEERVLRSFVTTIIPGIDPNGKHLIQAFHDDFYGFSKHRNFFSYELSRLGNRLFKIKSFDLLSPTQRIIVVEKGEGGGRISSSLFTGAILLAQISNYASVYDDNQGAEIIDFHGSNYGYRPEEMFYANVENYLSLEITADGNCP